MPQYMIEHDLSTLHGLDLRAARTAEIATWHGRRALKLDGLALLPDLTLADATIEVRIGADAASYPGTAWRAADALNYELAYAAPHTSGQWDAIQYDPVFHGSNTWQVRTGPAYQRTARVPTGEWFDLRVDVQGGRAAISVGGQSPLIVERLAHSRHPGRLGVWNYLSAYFCDLRVSECKGLSPARGVRPRPPAGAITEWLLEGFGVVASEPNGALCLNRYLPLSAGQARLSRPFASARNGAIDISFGFSDELSLEIDGAVVFSGTNTYSGMQDRPARGYVEAITHLLHPVLAAGEHMLAATLKVSEPFGWGLAMTLKGQGVRLLPAR